MTADLNVILNLNLLILDGFGIKENSVLILLFLKVFVSFLLHFVTLLDEKPDKAHLVWGSGAVQVLFKSNI